MITNNVSSSCDFQIQNHIYAQDESKLTHYGAEERVPQAILSESGGLLGNSARILVYMQQDLSDKSEQTMHPYEDQQIVKNTCVGTDELELLMLEDQ